MELARAALVSALLMIWAGVATAAPEAVIFTLASSTSAGGSFPSTQTFTPTLPFSGTGTIDEAAGTYSLNLPFFSIVIDVIFLAGNDAQLDTTGWGQIGTFAGGVGGALVSSSATGTTTCTDLGGGIGGAICATYPAPVAPWPPSGGAPSPPLGPPGATIDIGTNTIVVTEPFDVNGGQVQNTYTYTVVPPVPIFPSWSAAVFAFMLLGTAITMIRRRETA